MSSSRVSGPRVSDSRALAALATPIALTQLAQIALTTTDIAVMGTLGVTELAAGGLALVLFNQIRTMCVGLITATGNQIAAASGHADKHGTPPDDKMRDIVRAGFLVSTLAGLAGAAILVGLGWALEWFGQDAAITHELRPMLIALAPGLLPCLWFQVLRQFTVGMRRPQALLMITIGSIGLNLVLDLALTYGWFGLPRLGLMGIGLATSFVFLVSFVVFVAMILRDPVLGHLLPRDLTPPHKSTTGTVLRLGVPISLTYGSEAGLFSVLALVMGSIGPAALAAHNVVYQLVYIVFQVAIGLSQGASILVSRAVARDEIDHARRLARLALRQGAVVVAAAGVVYLLVPGLVLRPFLDTQDSAAVDTARTLLLVAIVLQFFDAAQNIGVGLLRGANDTKAGLRLSLVGYWLVGLPVAVLLAFPLGLGAAGVWWGLTAGLATTAVLMLRRYFTLLATRSHAELLAA